MATYQQHDDSCFVEEDDRRYTRMNTREAAKLNARQKQEMVACELSRLDSEEYLEDMMHHMKQLEQEMLPDANLIDMQREIQWYMRPFLIDFIIEAHAAFRLLPETLFLTVNLLDRYCSKRVVYKQHYQLVGCAALLIASKYGDRKERVPQISELNNMCCGLYDSGMFAQMETHVLNTLEWNIGFPTVDAFLQTIVAHESNDKKVESLASYMCEIALYHRDFVATKPSVMARAALALSRTVLGRPEAPEPDWDAADNDTRLALSQALHQPSATLARKYSASTYFNVASLLKEFLEEQLAIARRAALAQQQAALAAQQQAAAAAAAAASAAAGHGAPPTPPCDAATSAAAAAAVHSSAIYSTPHKAWKIVPGVADGYLTPPITPEGSMATAGAPPGGQCFGHVADPRSVYAPPRCPVTPTPNAVLMQQQQQSQHHQMQQQQYLRRIPSGSAAYTTTAMEIQ